MKFKSIEQLTELAKPIAEQMGLEIVEIEPKVSKNPSLTFFMEKAEGGIDLDTLEAFHNAIDPILDEADVSYGASYTLNVSSPGLTRPFKTERDYLRRIGKAVEVKLFAPINGEKLLEGILKEYDSGYVVIETQGREIKLELNKIAKINEAVIFDFKGESND